jgi:iron(III) transport system substrate-binding protein
MRPVYIGVITIIIIVIALGSIYYYESLNSRVTTLVVYGSLDTTDVQPLISSFEASHQGIKVSYIEFTPPQAYAKITTEIAASNSTADLIMMSNPITIKLQQGGYLTPYVSPESAPYPSDLKDPNGYWTAMAIVPCVFVYNTQKLSPSQLPQNLSALASPQWRGKVIMLDPTLGSVSTQYFGSLASVIGNSTLTQFIQQLETNVKPAVTPSTTAVTEDVANGQYDIGIVALLNDVLSYKSQGAPVNWFLPQGVPLLAFPESVAIIRTSQHLQADKAFVDFVLSPNAQSLLGNTDFRIPALPNVNAQYSIAKLAPNVMVQYFPSVQVVNESAQLASEFRQMGY